LAAATLLSLDRSADRIGTEAEPRCAHHPTAAGLGSHLTSAIANTPDLISLAKVYRELLELPLTLLTREALDVGAQFGSHMQEWLLLVVLKAKAKEDVAQLDEHKL
jgi:hypothetical protein